MAEVKDKIVTVDSLKAKHDYDEATYLKKSGGVITGDLTVGSDLYTTDIYFTENGGAKGFVYGKAPDGTYIGNFQPCNENGNCTIGHGSFTAGVGNTNIYAGDNINMFLAGDALTQGMAVFNARNGHGNMEINRRALADSGRLYMFGSDIYLNPSVGEYKPYFSTGDTIPFSIATAGYVTSASQDVCFTIPIAKPIVGTPSLTITADSGMVLRQGGKYTHGSSSGVTVKADAYTLTAYANGNYINVRAQFSNTTNATNNDSIGIFWSGTITLS